MNHTIPLTILLLTTGCELTDTVKPLLSKVLPVLKDAIGDLDIKGLAKDQACNLYRKRGLEQAEAAWLHDWPVFAGLFETPPDPVADMEWAMGQLGRLGVDVVYKTSDSSSSSAVCFQVQLAKNFDTKSPEQQAAVLAHEFGHIVEQRRVGCVKPNPGYKVPWLVTYGTVSGLLTSEGIQYALKDALLERYGVSAASIRREQKRRSTRFSDVYLVPEQVLSPECVLEYFDDIRGALRERAGV